MTKKLDFKEVGRDYVENYENLERKYGVYSASARNLIKLANIQETDTVVDLGCGTGISSQEIYQRIESKGKLIGIDVSSRMLELAEKKFQGKDNARFIVGDGFHLRELAEEKVDVVLSNFTYYYFLSNLDLLFRQVYETLKPNGKYVFNNTPYLTPLTFEGKEYNSFGYILWDEADKVLKKRGYKGRGEFGVNLSLVNNCEKVKEILEENGFSSVECRLSDLPITPSQALDFTYEGFFKYGSVTSFSSILKDIQFEKGMGIIKEIIKRIKQRFKDERVEETPKIFEILAIK